MEQPQRLLGAHETFGEAELASGGLRKSVRAGGTISASGGRGTIASGGRRDGGAGRNSRNSRPRSRNRRSARDYAAVRRAWLTILGCAYH
jgi:hypothetical protein